MTTTAPENQPAAPAQQVLFDRSRPAASAELVQKKDNLKMGALQREVHLLEAALESAYDELERRASRIAILEAQLAPENEEPTG